MKEFFEELKFYEKSADDKNACIITQSAKSYLYIDVKDELLSASQAEVFAYWVDLHAFLLFANYFQNQLL